MVNQDRYASVLNTLIEMAKAKGMESPGSKEATLCYDLIEAAISEAEVWGIPLEDIGLYNFDPVKLLKKQAA
jgi:hypothetical protein